MTRMLLLGSIVALALFGWTPPAVADAAPKVVRGTLTAVGADSFAVTVAGHDMKFTVDSTTRVEAVGAGTKTQAARAAGASGAPLSALLKSGQSVEVAYRDASGLPHASRIRVIAKMSSPDPSATERATGRVKMISATSLTIEGSSGGGARFTQTFAIDSSTRVVGKGVGTATASRGGRANVTDLVAGGDAVSVAYRKGTAGSLHASEVRIVQSPLSSSK